MTNADAWGLPKVLEFFDGARRTTGDVYPSEWFFLRHRLREGLTVLDIGCAQGGFASVLAEHLSAFSYTGVDINCEMIERAREKHPGQTFHHVPEGDYSVLADQRFDLVLILGILHLHESWRETIMAGWRHTAECLILDLRETSGPTIEDSAISFMRMDFHGGGDSHAEVRLPYVVLNAGDALGTVFARCPGARRISHFGYTHPVTGSAVCPASPVVANTYCIER